MRRLHAAWMIGLGLLGVARLGMARDAERLRDKSCDAQVAELREVAAGDGPARVTYARVLRQKVLENPGASHRAHARRALVKLWYIQAGASPSTSTNRDTSTTTTCADGMFPLSPTEASEVAADYVLSDAGVRGATELRKLLVDPATPPLRRAIAAHALSLNGAIPDQPMTEELLALIARENDPVARFEEALALAAYAQRSKTSFTRFKKLLLEEKDCAFAEALAVSLPGEDLRYRLFHGVGTKTVRARQVRAWLRAKSATGCKQ